MVLADVVPGIPAAPAVPKARGVWNSLHSKVVELQAEEKSDPDFIATFAEDKKGFYINGQLYKSDSVPMRVAHVGTYEHWRIVNATEKLHPMHIHQVHFLAFAENQRGVTDSVWLHTVNVPVGGVGRRHHGFQRSGYSWHVLVPLSPAESRRRA